MHTYTVELISRWADYDITVTGLRTSNARAARKLALRFMAAPDAWLVFRAYRGQPKAKK